MKETAFTDWLKEHFAGKYTEWEPLSPRSTFRIGGAARFALFPENEEDVSIAMRACAEFEIPYEVIGNASNVLFADEGYGGAILFTERMKVVYCNTTRLIAGAGVMLGTLCRKAQKAALHGLEFAFGIPGSVGGAVFMNAGAYGGEIGEWIDSVTFYDVKAQKVRVLTGKDCDFSYRHSLFQNIQTVILSASFTLVPGEAENIAARMAENMALRKSKQPLNYPSAGSVFRRYPGYFTAKLIDEVGLKGKQIGGAQVSEKHAGFIVNRGGASAKDVQELVALIQKTILNTHGIAIQCEIRYIHS